MVSNTISAEEKRTMSDDRLDIYAVLLAGGSGTRLWPVSRKLYPKQLVNFMGRDSLIQSTVKRLIPVFDAESFRIVCGTEHLYEIAKHLDELGIRAEGNIISEPCGRNTAPAILLALLSILKKQTDAIICVFPADHVIRDSDGFQGKLRSAVALASEGYIVTFGITPDYPETGYGYIEGSQTIDHGALVIKRFVEKPDLETAQRYLAAGNYFWNSGMFAFKASIMIKEFEMYQPQLLREMQMLLQNQPTVTENGYAQLANISIDYAIMEKTDRGVVLPSDFGWSDIGSWNSLYDFLPKDDQNNVLSGDVVCEDTTHCFIMGRDRLIATNHIHNMVVIETPDSVFVSDLERSRDVKKIVARLKAKGRSEYHAHKTVFHPWGSAKELENTDTLQTYRINVLSKMDCRLPKSANTSDRFMVIEGQARIASSQICEDLKAGDITPKFSDSDICITNLGNRPLVLIQIRLLVPSS